jgi:hypothetical protein
MSAGYKLFDEDNRFDATQKKVGFFRGKREKDTHGVD